MTGREEFAKIVRDPMNSPMRLLGAAISFVRVQGGTAFERQLADKLDEVISAEIRTAQTVAPAEGSQGKEG